MPRSLSELKLSDLAQRTDYNTFLGDIFNKVLRVRVPGTKGHHEVKMVRMKGTVVSVLQVPLSKATYSYFF